MGQAKNRGTRAQRIETAKQRDDSQVCDDDTCDGLQRYLGLNRLRTENESPFDTPDDAIVCMVSNIVPANQEAIQEQSGVNFDLDSWFVSSGSHEQTVVHGPFASLDESFEFARVNFSVVRFMSLDF